MIRISGGQFKGQMLKAPEGRKTRPTSAARRESLFNILQHRYGIEHARVLDLFAGTGALGFEALSRGASRAVFVEKESQALAALQANIEILGLPATQASILPSGKIKQWPAKLAGMGKSFLPFDLIFCDPPYGESFGQKCFGALEAQAQELFHPECLLVLEEDAKLSAPGLDGWQHEDSRTQGAGSLHFYLRKAQPG